MTIPKPPSQPGCVWAEECIEICDARTVFVEEHGVRAAFHNPRCENVRKIHYDHCYERRDEVLKADYIVGMPGVVDIIVELKGSDIRHARNQVESTLGVWKSSPIRFPHIACLVVYGQLQGSQRRAGRIPKLVSKNEAMERDFLRRNRALLWIRESGSGQYRFRDFLRITNA